MSSRIVVLTFIVRSIMELLTTSNGGPNLVPKKNTTSPVWSYFGLQANDQGDPIDKNTAICRICFTSVPVKGGTTSNIHSHLRNHHSKEFASLKQATAASGQEKSSRAAGGSRNQSSSQQQPTIVDVVNRSKAYERKGKKWQELTNSVTMCLCKDMLPIYSVEKPGFRDMLKKFDPQYEVPSRKYFSETAIPKLYNDERERVVKELESVKYYAATTDMWSSDTGAPFLSYTVHFIDEDWHLKSRCLQALYLPADHTADNLADALSSILENWKLDPLKQVNDFFFY